MRKSTVVSVVPAIALLSSALGCAGANDSTAAPEAVGSAESALTCVTIQRTIPGTGQVLDASIVSDPANPPLADHNFGAAPLTITGTVATSVRRSLMQFDLSSVPAGATVFSAFVSLFMNESPGGNPIEVHNVLIPWSENTVTWNLLGSSFDPSVAVSIPTAGIPPSSSLTADVTALVDAWVSGATPNYGVLFDHPAPGKTTFGASEAALSFRPSLQVCFTAPTCSDGIQNGSETGVDCGGPCAPCGCAPWSIQAPAAVVDIAVDAAGDTFAVGSFSGTVDFGSGPITAVSGSDGYVAKYDGTGQLLWVTTANVNSQDSNVSVAVDAAGNAHVAGIDSVGLGQILLTSYAPNGALLSSNLYTFGSQYHTLSALALDASGNRFVLGSAGAAFVAKVGTTGAVLWQKYLNGTAFARGIAVDHLGDVVAVGEFQGTLANATFSITSATPSAWDIFVVKLKNVAGLASVAKAFGGAGNEVARGVAVDSNNNIFVTGSGDSTLDFGGGVLPFAGGTEDMFLAKLTSAGAHVWSHSFGSAHNPFSPAESGHDLAVDAQDGVWMSGVALGTIDYGGGPVYAATAIGTVTNHVYASFDSQGNWTSARAFPGAASNLVRIALGADGGLRVAGNSIATDLGNGFLEGPFLGKLPCVAMDCGAGSCSGGAFCDACGCKDPTDPLSVAACGCGLVDPACGEGSCSAGFYCEKNHCASPVCYPPSSDVARALCTGGAIDGGCAVTGGIKRVFLSSSIHNGDLGGIAGADTICQSLASAASVPGTYQAWLSTAGSGEPEVSPRYRSSRFMGAYELLDGSVVANNWYELIDDQIDHAINLTETLGGPNPGSTQCAGEPIVWTNTAGSGASILVNDCNNWTYSQQTFSPWGAFGSATRTSDWSYMQGYLCSGYIYCSDLASLFCFEQ